MSSSCPTRTGIASGTSRSRRSGCDWSTCSTTCCRGSTPTRLLVSTGRDETRRVVAFDSIEEAFERELLAFRELVLHGTPPRTGIADGRTDIASCQRAIVALAARRGIEIGGEAAARSR